MATEDAGVEKLPDYLRSVTKNVIIGKKSFVFLDSVQLYLAGSCEEPLQVNGGLHGIEKTRVISKE